MSVMQRYSKHHADAFAHLTDLPRQLGTRSSHFAPAPHSSRTPILLSGIIVATYPDGRSAARPMAFPLPNSSTDTTPKQRISMVHPLHGCQRAASPSKRQRLHPSALFWLAANSTFAPSRYQPYPSRCRPPKGAAPAI